MVECQAVGPKGNFAIINADDYYGVDAYRLAAEYLNEANKSESNHFCMVGYGLSATLTENGTVSRGICTADEKGFLACQAHIYYIALLLFPKYQPLVFV